MNWRQVAGDNGLGNALLFAGFTDIAQSNGEVSAKRPPWALGASAPLNKPAATTAAAASAGNSAAAVWALAASDLTDDTIELAVCPLL